MDKNAVFKNLLFDLDGTLTDPALGITSAAQYALCKMGIEVADRTTLTWLGRRSLAPLRRALA